MKDPVRSQACAICWCFILLIFCVTGSPLDDTTLVQSASLLELVNKDIEITCSVKGATLDHLRRCWSRKTNGDQNLEFILCASGARDTSVYGTRPNLQERFSMTRGRFSSYFTLKIANVQLSDSGIYYCMAQQTVNFQFGNGTLLTVVESLPTTQPTTTQEPRRKNTKKGSSSKRPTPGLSCSAVIWAPLTGMTVILLIGLSITASHTYPPQNKKASQATHHSL